MLTVVPNETRIPFTVELALLPDTSQIVFLKTLVVVAPPIEIPVTADAPVLARVLIALLLILINVEVFVQVIPVTLPPVPIDNKLLIVFVATAMNVAAFEVAPIVTPVIVLRPVIFVIVLLERLETPFQ